MKRISMLFLLTILLFSTNLVHAQTQPIPGSFEFEGYTRHYEVWLPQNYQPTTNMPLVLCLHGINMELWRIDSLTLLGDFADTSDFVLVYPLGHRLDNGMPTWNNGLSGTDNWIKCDPTFNDVGFISALIDTVIENYAIDLSRIYCCGFSMGGAMTYRLSIELGHRFAAIASVAGKMNDNIGNLGLPLRPIPVMHFHGTDDNNTPYGLGPGNQWSVNQIINFWVQNNNCTMTPDTIDLPDIDLSDSTTVQKISFTNCSDSANFIHYKIFRMGHHWPKFVTNYTTPTVGYTNRDIEANIEIWNFFKNYTNPLVDIAWTKRAEITPRHLSLQGTDTLLIIAYTENQQNHPLALKAFIEGQKYAYSDSLTLYDDGMHGDGAANDNIWGNFLYSTSLPEDKYFVDIYTYDQFAGTIQKYHYFYSFLKLGPVVLDYYTTNKPPYDSSKVKFKYTLYNESTTATLSNIKSKVTALDSFSIFLQTTIDYNEIPPDTSIEGNGGQYITFDLGIYDSIDVHFRIDIYKDEFYEWSDTFSVFVIKDPLGLENENYQYPMVFELKQNYPNPFNLKTTLEFSIPKTEFVTVKIYNLLGQEITTLVSDKLKAGEYNFAWNAENFATGIYFYKLEAGEYVEARKLILMK